MIALAMLLSGLSVAASAPVARVAYIDRATAVSGYAPDLRKALERKLGVSLMRVDDPNIEPSHVCAITGLRRLVYVDASLAPMHPQRTATDSTGPSIYGLRLDFVMYECTPIVRQLSAVRVGEKSAGDAATLSSTYARTLAELLDRIGTP